MRKWGISAAVAFVFIGAFVWFFGFQTLMLIETHYSYRHVPIAHMTPVELRDRGINVSEGTTLSAFGYDFEVPWKDVDAEHITRKRMIAIPFRSGLAILVGHGSSHDLVDTTLENTKTDPQVFRAAYGDSALQSDYEFLKLALNTTPASIRLTDSKQDVVRKSALVLIKAIVVPGDSGIFEVQANNFRGFQYGDPGKHPKRITVTLYSADGGVEFSFLQNDLSPVTISQADINRVIQTLHYRGADETVVSNEVSQALVGEQITVHGRFSLLGKIAAAYVVLDNDQVVYLRGSWGWGEPYADMEGKRVAATGFLGFYKAPPVKPTKWHVAHLPDHYYFEETARLRLISP